MANHNFTFAVAGSLALLAASGALADTNLVYTDQGTAWTATTRVQYYTQDQGSRMIPLSWLRALKQKDGTPFLADELARYGYLKMDGNNNGLPLGFTVSGLGSQQEVGMTCSACHTREITHDNTSYRIDGGPALSDFHAFLTDLDAATQALKTDKAAYTDFAKAVLGTDYEDMTQRVLLQVDFNLWTERFHTIVSLGVPHDTWGVGRLDAVGMIFNRLTGLDLGVPPSRIIAGNIQPADAPVRYPFLWNAAIQDKTQWPGFAENGSNILGLARNVGEVYGVFGDFAPVKEWWSILGYDYLKGNSLNFEGLNTLENLIKVIGPPKYPFAINADLAKRGETLFNASAPGGSCWDCHGQKPGKPSLGNATWATPVLDVGTDTREYQIMNWSAKPGVMTGARIPFANDKLGTEAPSIDILTVAVGGSIIQHYAEELFDLRNNKASLFQGTVASILKSKIPEQGLSADLQELKNAFPRGRGEKLAKAPPKTGKEKPKTPTKTTTTAPSTPSGNGGKYAYESRVLYGIWAAAPYLHNGSVPTLDDLLKPADQRPGQFAVGAAYDPSKAGLAATQTGLHTVTVTTDCTDLNSGNSRCGHEFGTSLSADDRAALVEYLKTL